MDSRDCARATGKWYESIDEKAMTADVWLPCKNENSGGWGEELITTPIKYDVCPLCEGKGTHVNPSIDSHGISPEEFYDDPDFAEDYFSGKYDVSCYECGGRRVVPVPVDEEVKRRVDDLMYERAQSAAEESYAIRMGY